MKIFQENIKPGKTFLEKLNSPPIVLSYWGGKITLDLFYRKQSHSRTISPPSHPVGLLVGGAGGTIRRLYRRVRKRRRMFANSGRRPPGNAVERRYAGHVPDGFVCSRTRVSGGGVAASVHAVSRSIFIRQKRFAATARTQPLCRRSRSNNHVNSITRL